MEDRGTIQYLQDCATEAEIATEFLYIDDIGLGEKGQFTDLQDQVISNLFKLYPWKFMLREILHQAGGCRRTLAGTGVEEHYLQQGTSTAVVGDVPESPEPAARSILRKMIIRKWKNMWLSRSSPVKPNVSIIENGKTIEAAEGPYGEEGMIVQQFHPLPKFGDSYMLIGSWLVNDQPAGIGIREDRAFITAIRLGFIDIFLLNKPRYRMALAIR